MRSSFRLFAAAVVALCLVATALSFDSRVVRAASAPIATVYTVNSTADSDDGSCLDADCTLREAITLANMTPELDKVAFNIPGAGSHVIAVTSGLPLITSPIDIDGRTQPDYAPQFPVIELDGSQTTIAALRLEGGHSSVRGLAIRHFRTGIVLTGAGDNVIEANHLFGDRTLPSQFIGYGLFIGSPDNQIGRDSEDARNVIAGFGFGIGGGDPSTNVRNVVEGNFIGTDVTGSFTSSQLGMTEGIEFDGNSDTIAANVVAGNGLGITISGADNRLVNNRIGTDVTGMVELGNAGVGLDLHDSSGTLIESNVISANGFGECTFFCPGLNLVFNDGTIVRRNWIGTDATGNQAFGNHNEGILAQFETNATIDQNVISANGLGVFLNRTENTLIVGNLIGTNSDGDAGLGNGSDGVTAQDSSGLVIGGTDPGSGNVISANGGGVTVRPSGALGVPFPAAQIQGNLIGTDPTGTRALGNQGAGVFIGLQANGTLVGGTMPEARNLISSNLQSGVSLDTVSGVLVQGNYIGTDITGHHPLGNGGDGVHWVSSVVTSGNLIGGTADGAGNLVSANVGAVILVGDPGTVVLGNRVGTDVTGTEPMGNAVGVRVISGGNTTIGSPGAGNLISANRGAGVEIVGGRDLLQDNLIGTDISGVQPLGNGGAGVRLSTHDTLIGGLDREDSNTIAFNVGAGVSLGQGTGNAFRGNAIFSNGELGIDLGPVGVTANDPGDPDEGPNGLQNFPLLTDVSSLAIQGTLNSEPNRTYQLEFFASDACDPSGYGEGQSFLGALPVFTDGTGDADFTFVPVDPIPLGACVAATATAPDNSTSEFSGGLVLVPRSGRIRVQKVTVPAPNATLFDFRASYDGDGFSLSNGQQNDSGDLEPGAYSVLENVPLGWDNTGATCDNGDSPDTITLGVGDTVTCTFTNTQRGSIVVRKDAVGGDGTFAFTSNTLGGFSLTTGGGTAARTFANLLPGTYDAAEIVPPGWDLTGAACDDGSTPSSIALDPGETVTCTFTDTARGRATVVKTVSGAAPTGTQAFTFQLRQGASSTQAGTTIETLTAAAANGGILSFPTTLVVQATYQLCEIVMPGWKTTLSPVFPVFDQGGDNSTLCSDFTVGPGQTRSFAVDNTPPPGGLARTIGFWKNWASCAKSNGGQRPVLDQTLALAEPSGITIGTLTLHGSTTKPSVAPDCSKAVNLLNKSTIDGKTKKSSDAAFNLAAQLLAAKLNLVAGARACSGATTGIAGAQALLASLHFDGLTHDHMSASQATQANSLATLLDKYNNNLLC